MGGDGWGWVGIDGDGWEGVVGNYQVSIQIKGTTYHNKNCLKLPGLAGKRSPI